MGRASVGAWLCLVCLSALSGCDRLIAPRHEGLACSADFETCDGARDCFSACVCETGDAQACEAQCGSNTAPRVSDLDQSAWPEASVAFEAEVLALSNEARVVGGCCGEEGCFEPSEPLRHDAALQTAARAHAKDMAERDYFDHDSPEGIDPFDRMREAGYRGCAMGENIAGGQSTPREVVDGWLESPGHCSNILRPSFTRLGAGYFHGAASSLEHLWVQSFGG